VEFPLSRKPNLILIESSANLLVTTGNDKRYFIRSCLEDRVRSTEKKTTLSTADLLTTLDENVAVHTPAATPGVLDLPVFVAIRVGTVTNGKNTVVKAGAAVANKDTLAVELEGKLISFNGNGNRLLGNGLLEAHLAVLDINEASRGTAVNNVTRALAAVGEKARAGGVRVVILRAKTTILHDPLEGIVHETTVAALINLVAVHKLLLRERNELTSFKVVGTLESTSGGEGPAATAGALVLDRGDGALLDPVYLVRNIRETKGRGIHLVVLTVDLGVGDLAVEAKVGLGKLLVGEVCKLVQTELVRVTTLVVKGNGLEVISKGAHVLEDFSGAELHAILACPLVKEKLKLLTGKREHAVALSRGTEHVGGALG